MDWYQVLSVFATIVVSLISAICVLFWYIIRETVVDMKALEKGLQEHKLYVSEHYARMADVKQSYEKLYGSMEDCLKAVNRIATDVAVLANKVDNRTDTV